MSTVAAPHQGLGVAHYMWSSSPLRRYVDLVNQRQIMSVLREGAPAYRQERHRAVRHPARFRHRLHHLQRIPARTWNATGACAGCCRKMLSRLKQSVLRENLVRVVGIPLVFRAPSLPEELPANTRVQLEIGEIDLLDLHVQTRFIGTLEEGEG